MVPFGISHGGDGARRPRGRAARRRRRRAAPASSRSRSALVFMAAMTLLVIADAPCHSAAVPRRSRRTATARPRALAATLLVVGASFFIADGVQTVAAGALRGLNDTRVPLLFAALSFWVIGFRGCYRARLSARLGRGRRLDRAFGRARRLCRAAGLALPPADRGAAICPLARPDAFLSFTRPGRRAIASVMTEHLTIDHASAIAATASPIATAGRSTCPIRCRARPSRSSRSRAIPTAAHLLRVEQPSAERDRRRSVRISASAAAARSSIGRADRYRDWKRDLVVEALAQAGIDAPVDELIDAHGEGRRRATLHARQRHARRARSRLRGRRARTTSCRSTAARCWRPRSTARSRPPGRSPRR